MIYMYSTALTSFRSSAGVRRGYIKSYSWLMRGVNFYFNFQNVLFAELEMKSEMNLK